MNEEVVISLRANAKPFQDAMNSAVKSIDMATMNMTDFTSMVQNANKLQLKNIASNLQQGIKDTTLIIKDMQKELVIASQTNAPTKFTQQLRNDIVVAKSELTDMQKRLKMVGGTPLTGLQKQINMLKSGIQGVTKIASGFGKKFMSMISFSAIFGLLGVMRTGLTDAVGLSDSATNNFGAMANVIAGSLVPIVNSFATAIRNAFVWVAGLIKYLTGFNMIQAGIDATNKKIQKIGTSAKKSGKQVKDGMLSGLDEITNIETSSGGGGATASGGGADMTAQLGAMGTLNDMMAQMNSLDFSWAEPLKVFLQFLVDNAGLIATLIMAIVVAVTLYNVVAAVMAIINGTISLTVLLIVGAIVMVIAIIILCIVYWDEIKAFVGKVIEAIVGFVIGLAEKIGELFVGIFNLIVSVVEAILSVIVGIIKAIWNAIVSVVTFIIDLIVACVMAIILAFSTIVAKIVGFFTSVWNGIVSIFKGIGKWFGDRINDIITFFKELPGKLKTFFQNAWNGMVAIFGGIGRWFGDRINDIVNFFKALPEKVGNAISTLWTNITSFFTDIGTTVGDAVSGAISTAIQTVLETGVNIINGFLKAINGAISLINEIPGVNISKLKLLEVPSFDVGTNYVPHDMLAMVHKGERITPAKYNNDDWVSDGTDMAETNSLLQELISVVASKNFTIGKDAIGRASVDYIMAESRRRGEAII